MREKTYAHYLSTVQWFNLNTCVQPICKMFGYQVFLVGSALQRKDWRDVDIRIIVNLDSYGEWFKTEHHRKCMGMMMSEWLSARTGLPIDLQIQGMDEANKEYGDQPRNALGITI